MLGILELIQALAETPVRKTVIAVCICASANGCATVKSMTADFERKWDDPKSIIAEMDQSSARGEAANASVEAMTAFNSNDCAKRSGLLDIEADAATRVAQQVATGECLLAVGKNEDAAKIFTLAAEADGGAPALQGMGVALVRLGRFNEAVSALETGVALDPGLVRAWNAYGVALDNLDRREDAEAAFVKAVALAPNDGAALNNLGVLQMKTERRAEAIAAFKSALNADGAREAAEANLRLAYALEGDYAASTRALADENRAIALNNAGVAAASRGDNADAKRLLTLALEESAHFYAKAYNNLSMLVE